MDIPIIGVPAGPARTVEVCRSFSYKLNLANHGGPGYESVDLFASRKMSVPYDERAVWSQQLYEECQAEVRAAVTEIKANMLRKLEVRRSLRNGDMKEMEAWKAAQEGQIA